ncbi:MAG: ribosome silencing factor [Bacillota bacterium]
MVFIDTPVVELNQHAGIGKKEARNLAVKAARSLYDGKGSDVVILDVGDITLIADFFVIASGSNPRHVQALADRVVYSEDITRKPMHVEGYGLGHWVLLDYGDVVVHVFREEERGFYGLERLWGDAPQVDFEPERRTGGATAGAGTDISNEDAHGPADAGSSDEDPDKD